MPSDSLSVDAIYDELRQLAHGLMAREAAHVTIQPTALVHEAWLRLGGDEQPSWERRAHFFGAAAEAMRRVLIDAARKRNADKRGGNRQRVTLLDVAEESIDDDVQLLELDEALREFEALDESVAAVVKLRYFAGLTIGQTASTLNRSESTIKREWTFALAWLRDRMRS